MRINNISNNFSSLLDVEYAGRTYGKKDSSADEELINLARQTTKIRADFGEDYLCAKDSLTANRFLGKCAQSNNPGLALNLLRYAYLDRNIVSVLTKDKYKEITNPFIFSDDVSKSDALKGLFKMSDEAYNEISKNCQRASKLDMNA